MVTRYTGDHAGGEQWDPKLAVAVHVAVNVVVAPEHVAEAPVLSVSPVGGSGALRLQNQNVCAKDVEPSPFAPYAVSAQFTLMPLYGIGVYCVFGSG